jgi:hypothetical protein
LAAQWQRVLRKEPDPHSNLDILVFEKQAVIQQPAEKMGLAADRIQMWIERQPRKNKDKPPAVKQPREQANLRPKRLLAENAVVLDSPQMVANGNRLEAWFEEVAALPDAAPKK